MKIIQKTTLNANEFTQTTYHLTEERQHRLAFINKLGGKVVASFIVDKNHVNGLEVHTILDSGVVAIGNNTSKKLITHLIARPEQLRRYGITDTVLLKKALEHQLLGYNNL